MRKELDVVISRYSENIDWVFGLPEHANTIVYNKGSDINMGFPLPNLGRESHTYLHHILAVYNKLPNYESDYIAFLQGNPFDHCPDVIQQLEVGIYRGSDFTPLGNERLTCNLKGEPHHPDLDLKTFGDLLLRKTLPDSLTFTPGAQFVIHKRVLSRVPVDFFWSLLVNTVQNPQVPYMLERTWEKIFNDV